MRALLLATLLALPLAAPAGAAADEPPLAIVGGRVEPVSGPPLDPGVVLVEGGKIAAVGPAAEVEIPPGAERLDATGRTVLPGFVNPVTQVGLSTTAATSGTTPELDPVPALDPRSRSLRDALRAGFTTLAVTREGSGIPGTGVAIRPAGRTARDLVVLGPAFLRMTAGTGTRELERLARALDRAQAEIDAAAKYEKDLAAYEEALAEAKKKAEEAKKKGEKEPAPPKLTAPKEPAANPRTEAVRRAVRGEIPVFVRVGSATELLHFEKVAEGRGRLRVVVLFEGGDAYRVTGRLAERGFSIVLRPLLETEAYTEIYRNVPVELAAAGVPFALHPWPDRGAGHRDLRLALGRLVRAGLPRERALRAVTLDAAKLLGLGKRLGSLEKGKDANLVIYSGDPLDARTRIETVMLEGHVVLDAEEDRR